MKQTLLLLLLALGMLSINVSAQVKKPVRKTTTKVKPQKKTAPKKLREYQIGEDGFEWYKIYKNSKYGAEDRNGNTIVPAEYDDVEYNCFCYDCVGYSPVSAGFVARKGEYKGWYNKSGRCVIPYSRGYTYIRKHDDEDFGTHYSFIKKGGGGICDKNGKIIVTVNIDNLSNIFISKTLENEKCYYFFLSKKGSICGVADANGKVVIYPDFKYDGQKLERLISARVKTTNNPLSGNTRETLAEAEGRSSGSSGSYSSSTSSSSTASSSSSSSSSNSGNNSTTIHVEHHHDPVPMQQWQACIGCGGMGTMGCDFCGGSGTKYVGDNLRICSRCNGQGIIPCNVCYGNKGQYITIYR